MTKNKLLSIRVTIDWQMVDTLRGLHKCNHELDDKLDRVLTTELLEFDAQEVLNILNLMDDILILHV